MEMAPRRRNFLQAFGSAGLLAGLGGGGLLRPGLTPEALAMDTFMFVGGLVKHWLGGGPDSPFRRDAEQMVRTHVALRRA